jgi:hypothetical protein
MSEFDREIDLKAIGKWLAALAVVIVLAQVSMVWMLRGMNHLDTKGDPAPLPIQQEMQQEPPPLPRLQASERFDRLNPEAPPDTRSDVEDMQLLVAADDAKLHGAAWLNQAEGTVRVPIDVAMQVIAQRGAAAPPVEPPATPQEP